MAISGDTTASAQVGAMTLSILYLRERPDELGGLRSQFGYEVGVDGRVFSGEDLFSGVGVEVSARRMLGTFAAFLADAGERYRTGMCPPDDEYPEWVYEQAYLHADELAIVSWELEELPRDRRHGQPRWAMGVDRVPARRRR